MASKKLTPKTATSESDDQRIALGVWTAQDGTVAAVLPHAIGSAGGSSTPGTKVSRINTQLYDLQTMPHATWGVSDTIPQRIQSRLSKVPMAARAVFDMASLLVGQGVVYVKDAELQTGESQVKRGFDAEIERFKNRNRLHTNFLFGMAQDIASVYNGFCECITDPFGEKIVQVRRLPAAYSRISRIDDVSLRSENLYYSAAFQGGYYPDYKTPSQVTTIPLYDPFDFEWFDKFRAKKLRKFAVHIKPPTLQEGYYAVAPWNGLYLDSGWVDVAADVPRVVKSMQDNQIALKYIIYISEQYMVSRFPKWSSMKDTERQAAQSKVTKEVEGKLVGVDNVFSSLTLIAREGPDGKMYGKITVEPVEDKAKTGTWIPDTAAANREILYGHFVHPTLVGIQAQGGSEAGSGSDKRESRNDAITQVAVLQATLYETLNCVVKEYNQWDYTFLPDNVLHTTTNNVSTGLEPNNKRPTVTN